MSDWAEQIVDDILDSFDTGPPDCEGPDGVKRGVEKKRRREKDSRQRDKTATRRTRVDGRGDSRQ